MYIFKNKKKVQIHEIVLQEQYGTLTAAKGVLGSCYKFVGSGTVYFSDAGKMSRTELPAYFFAKKGFFEWLFGF